MNLQKLPYSDPLEEEQAERPSYSTNNWYNIERPPKNEDTPATLEDTNHPTTPPLQLPHAHIDLPPLRGEGRQVVQTGLTDRGRLHNHLSNGSIQETRFRPISHGKEATA